MALRTIGSTLLARSSPGGALRSKDEALINQPDIPNTGAIGSVSRQMVEEPLQRQVPEGSAKVVSVTPTVEGTTVAAPGTNPAMPMAPINTNGPASPVGILGNGPSPSNTPSVGASQPLFAGGVSPEAGPFVQPRSSVRSGATGTAVSGGPVTNTSAATAYQPTPEPTPMPVRGGASQPNAQVLGLLSGLFGTKAIASEAPKTMLSTLGQQISGSIGKRLTNIGTAFHAPQLVPGGLGARMQSYGGAPSVTQSGGGSIKKAIRSVANAVRNNLRSGRARSGRAMGQAASKVSGFLRSLFR